MAYEIYSPRGRDTDPPPPPSTGATSLGPVRFNIYIATIIFNLIVRQLIKINQFLARAIAHTYKWPF